MDEWMKISRWFEMCLCVNNRDSVTKDALQHQLGIKGFRETNGWMINKRERCFLAESGSCGQRHLVPGHATSLGADPALGGRHGGAAAPLRGVRKHSGPEHEEDVPEPLHHRHATHR